MTVVQQSRGVDIVRSARWDTRGVVFGMSTRRGGVSPPPLGMNLSFSVGDNPANVEKNRKIFCDAMGISQDRLAFPMQVHSATVTIVEAPGRYPACDALVTNKRDVYLCVSVADCVPVFLHDPAKGVIAGVHAGWRGSAEGIAARALACMHDTFGTDPRDVVAFIGPSADKCCYAVGPDVAGKFAPAYRHETNGSTTVDLKQANREQLIRGGVADTSIEVSPLCTISEADLLHSYRRDGPRSGRMIAVLGMPSER